MLSTASSSSGTVGNNAPRLLRDTFGGGNLLLAAVNIQGGLTAIFAPAGGATWSSSTLAAGPGYDSATWAMGPGGPVHLVYKGPSGLAYQRYNLTRDASNNVTGLLGGGWRGRAGRQQLGPAAEPGTG